MCAGMSSFPSAVCVYCASFSGTILSKNIILITKIVEDTAVYGGALIHLSTLLSETLIIIGLVTLILGKVMIVWCGSLFGIVLLLVGWNLFTWFFSATHSGKNKQSDLDQAGVSVRLIIALLSTVPLSAGYCFFQYGHILINGYSIQNANKLANIAYDNMNVGGQFNSQTNIQSEKLISQLFETFICNLKYH